jgi:broad specificity phosphatase PhoE
MPAPSLRLFLVRHGETASNRELRYLGSQDEPLTENGRRQAESLASALACLSLAAVYASPLLRAAQTGERIAARLRLPLQPEPRLREQRFGEWEGLSRAEVLQRGDVERDLLLRCESDPDAAPPGGESLALVAGRVQALAGDLAAAHPGGQITVVSHVGPIKALLCAALAAPLTAARRLFLDPGTLTVIDWGEAPVVRLFNSHALLDWQEARWRS